jgi:hypothetical protein
MIETYPTVPATCEAFAAAGFRRVALEPVRETPGAGLAELLGQADTLRQADTTMRHLTEAEFRRGKERLRRAVQRSTMTHAWRARGRRAVHPPGRPKPRLTDAQGARGGTTGSPHDKEAHTGFGLVAICRGKAARGILGGAPRGAPSRTSCTEHVASS